MGYRLYLSSSLIYPLPIQDLQAKCPWVRCLQGDQQSLDQNTRQIHKGGPPQCVVNTISGPPPKTTQDRTRRIQPNPRPEIKIPDPAGNRTWVAGLEGRGTTDHATATDFIPEIKRNGSIFTWPKLCKILFCNFCHEFFCKLKNNRDIKGIQIYGTSLKLKNGLTNFNEIWSQQYNLLGVDYALYLFSKYLEWIKFN